MYKIFAFSLFFLWFSEQIIAKQISSLNEGEEVGTARYYATQLNGKLTSYGEKYDDSKLTASHSRYPLNTLVKVTNLENNLRVQVRINDFCKCEEEGKIINLSKEAASKLGMMVSGKARVRLEVIPPPPTEKVIDKALLGNHLNKGREVTSKEEVKTPVLAHSKTSVEPFSVNHTYDVSGTEKYPKGFGVQVTAISSLNLVKDSYDELLKMGVKKEAIFVQVGEKDSVKIYRLMFGEFYTKEEANDKLTWLLQHGYKGLICLHYIL